MLLIEKLVAGAPVWPNIERELFEPDGWNEYISKQRRLLKSAVPFEVSNVARYLYLGTTQEEWRFFDDFPRPMPPFKFMWMEWLHPLMSNSEGTFIPLPISNVVSRIGALIASEENSADDAIRHICRWKINIIPYIEPRGQKSVLIGPTMMFGLSDAFEAVAPHISGKLSFAFTGVNPERMQAWPESEQQSLMSSTTIFMHPAMLALSFLNCRNTTIHELCVPPRLLKKHIKHGHPLNFTSHRIIEIQPMRKVIKSEGCADGHSRRAAAIMRGHFKDYRSGAGLFGKLHGLFWWDQRIEGNIPAEYRLSHAHGELSPGWRKS